VQGSPAGQGEGVVDDEEHQAGRGDGGLTEESGPRGKEAVRDSPNKLWCVGKAFDKMGMPLKGWSGKPERVGGCTSSAERRVKRKGQKTEM